MESDGKTMFAAIKQVRTLFEDVGKLLATCDAMMREREWEENPRIRNTCISGMSYSIQLPRNWLPYMVFRFFQNKDLPHLLVGACVIFDDADLPTRVTEPLVCCVVFNYERGEKVPDSWTYDYASWHVWIRNAKDDGTPITIDPRTEWPNEKVTASRLTSFAVPLVSITDSETLKAQVVLPLDRIARHEP